MLAVLKVGRCSVYHRRENFYVREEVKKKTILLEFNFYVMKLQIIFINY